MDFEIKRKKEATTTPTLNLPRAESLIFTICAIIGRTENNDILHFFRANDLLATLKKYVEIIDVENDGVVMMIRKFFIQLFGQVCEVRFF